MKKLLLLSAALCVAAPAFAADPHAHHAPAKVSASAKKSPSTSAYIKAANIMHKAMDVKYTGNADVDFARGMVPHHQGAVDMTKVLLKHTKDETLHELGERIILWQETEIGMMTRWLRAKDNYSQSECNCDAETTKKYRTAMDKMHKDMNIRYTGNVDVDFVNGMIPHHQGAIDMAWIQIEHGVDPELRALSRDIIRSQEQEIALMKAWLAEYKGKK